MSSGKYSKDIFCVICLSLWSSFLVLISSPNLAGWAGVLMVVLRIGGAERRGHAPRQNGGLRPGLALHRAHAGLD
jgi:hypothetical protein